MFANYILLLFTSKFLILMNYRYHGSVIDLDSEDDDQKIDPIMKMNTHSSYSYSSWARDIQDPFVSNPDFASRNKKAL